jgi:hypothetical protein
MLGMSAHPQPPMVNSAAWGEGDENAPHAGAGRTESTLHPRTRTLSGSGLSLRMRIRRHIALRIGGNRSGSRDFGTEIRNPGLSAPKCRPAF